MLVEKDRQFTLRATCTKFNFYSSFRPGLHSISFPLHPIKLSSLHSTKTICCLEFACQSCPWNWSCTLTQVTSLLAPKSQPVKLGGRISAGRGFAPGHNWFWRCFAMVSIQCDCCCCCFCYFRSVWCVSCCFSNLKSSFRSDLLDFVTAERGLPSRAAHHKAWPKELGYDVSLQGAHAIKSKTDCWQKGLTTSRINPAVLIRLLCDCHPSFLGVSFELCFILNGIFRQ